MHAMVHRETCIRCGLCPTLCPEVFDLPEGEAAQVIADPVPEECRADDPEQGTVENLILPAALGSKVFFLFAHVYIS